MGKILDALIGFINANQWPVLPGEDQSLRMFYQGKNGHYSCVAQALEEQGIALFYSIAPVNVPEHKRQVVAEFITRVNYGLLLGNFEMDYDDGEVRFRTSAGADGIEWAPEMIKPLMYVNLYTMDMYLSGMLEIIYGDAQPVLVIERYSDGAVSMSQAE